MRSTDEGLIDALMAKLPQYGLVPFKVLRESDGFIFNRIWAAIKRECLMVVEEGVATPEDVDAMWTIFTAPGMPPFRLMDRVGLDVVLAIEEHYAAVRAGHPGRAAPAAAGVRRRGAARREERPRLLRRAELGGRPSCFAVFWRCRWSVGRGDTPVTRGSWILGGEEDSIDRSCHRPRESDPSILPGSIAPRSLAGLLAEFRPCFTAPTFQTFIGLVVGLIGQTRRRTVCGMVTGAGLEQVWHHSPRAP